MIMETLHKLNILTHVMCGSAALLLGFVALLVNKGKRTHKRVGNVFLVFMAVVILTGLLGVFVFGRNTFLLVITALSGYFGFSGYRTLQTKSNQPKLLDILVALASLATVVYFLYYMSEIGLIWAPVVIYSTVGTLLAIIAYDLLRYLIPKAAYGRMWLYEHIYKMIGAFSALLAAFSGTVFKAFQPYSQIVPSAIGIALQVGFILYYIKKKRHLSNKTNQERFS
jgi:uncharacterized membrane protein